jgi:hypothetical protein
MRFLKQQSGNPQCREGRCGSTLLDGFSAQEEDLCLYQKSAYLQLGHSRPAASPNIVEPTKIPGTAPNPYLYFVLQTRLRSWLAHVDPTLDLMFDTRPSADKKKIEYICYLMRGTYNVALSPEEGKVLTQKAQEILTGAQSHFCCLLHPACPPKVGITTLPSYWIQSVLPFCVQILDPEYQPQILEGGLCVRLPDEGDFLQHYRLLNARLNEQLAYYFNRGTVVLGVLEQGLLDTWQLKIVDTLPQHQLLLATARWYDPLLTNFHPTHFLRTRMLGRREIAFPLKVGKALRHLLAVAWYSQPQTPNNFWFTGQHFYTCVDSYREAVRVKEICLQVEVEGQGQVYYLGQAPGVSILDQSDSQSSTLPRLWFSPEGDASCVIYPVREERIEHSVLSILGYRPLLPARVEEILDQWQKANQ